ncbi:prealbumin-like fold domain-containing protein [Actinoplanes flavus]|uniref:DUF11 domain-containing protein n=1 Tax=Actinoplanes flavus TaxID=2820290 RepID=A0ABS3V0A6_9ACTN|nr:DUF11 domain-containing protein [Actinoplanes flavus]MBO3744271.1 DUF11 domain-containing protein [Actinoplanes flavus]
MLASNVRSRRPRAVLAVTALVLLPMLTFPAAPVSAAAPRTWDGSRAELFLTDVTTPAIAPGGGARPVTATLVNHGPSNATSIRFTYTVPTGLAYQGATVGAGTCAFAAPTVTCTVPSLADGSRVPVSVQVSAPAGTPNGDRAGSFGPVTADQFTPAGGDLLMRVQDPYWIGSDERTPISPSWPPSDPYTGPPPACRNFTDAWGELRPCSATVSTKQVLTQSTDTTCWPTPSIKNCIRTWEIAGTYHAPRTGSVTLCMSQADDGAYVNWSAGYDPATRPGPNGGYHNVAETPSYRGTWNTAGWPVVAGQAYRFSIRVANRDRASESSTSGGGGFAGFGLSTVGGDAGTCSFGNFAPAQPANVTVSAAAAGISLSKQLTTPRAEAGDQFTVQIRDGATVIGPTAASTTAGTGATVTPGTGTTGSTDVTPGTTYTLTEVAAGTTNPGRYQTSISCTNSRTGSPTVLPAGPVDLAAPPTVTPAAGDAIECVLANTPRPRVTIVTNTAVMDGTFGYTVTGGPAPAHPSITTSGRTGRLVLTGTQVGQQVDVIPDPVTGWRLTSSVCADARSGAAVRMPYTLRTADDVVCTFVHRPLAAVYQPCAANRIRNGAFGTGLTGWTGSGGWTAAGGRAVNGDPGATFGGDRLGQPINGITAGATVAVDVVPVDGTGGSGGNRAELQIVYGGTVYATVTTSPAATGFGGNATVTAAGGATASPASIPMAGGGTVTVVLPGSVPRAGDLEFRMAVTESADTAADRFAIDDVVVHAAAICLQVESVGGYGTFAFQATNADTDPATPAADPGLTVTTTAADNPATVSKDFSSAAPHLSLLAPGTDVVLTQTGPADWRPDTVDCLNAATGAAVPASIAAGAVTVDGAAITGRTTVNCYLTEEPLAPKVTLVATTISRDATFHYTVGGGPAPAAPAITTTNEAGSRTLDHTQIGQVLTITQNRAPGWRTTTRVCVEARTGAVVPLPYTLRGGDDLTCTFTNRPVAPADQPCPVTNLIRNDAFDDGLTGWTRTGSWVATGGRATNPDPAATFGDNRLAQSISGVAPLGAIAVDLVPRDTGEGDRAALQIWYGGTLYATVETSPAGGAAGSATVTEAGGATVSPAGIPMNQSRTLVVYLPPAGVPKSGEIAFRQAVTPTGAATTDTFLLDEVRVLTTAVCLQVRSLDDVGTFRYTTGNLDTDPTVPADVPVFAVTTEVANRPVTVNPDFTATGTQLLVPTPDLDVALTQAGPAGWIPTELDCYDAFTGKPVPTTLTGTTVTIDGAGMTAYRIVNCRLTHETHRYTVTKTAGQTRVRPGQPVTYTVTVTNTGATGYPDATVHDRLTGVLDDAVLTSAKASRGTVTYASPNLTWHGTLSPGRRAVITYTVRVKDSGHGDRRLRNTVTADAPGASCAGPATRCRSTVPVGTAAGTPGAPREPGTPDQLPATGPAPIPAGYLATVLIVLGLLLRRVSRRPGAGSSP